MPKRQYQAYVIELSKRVFTENAFKQHKSGYRNKKGHKLSSSVVQKYGMYLRPSLYNHIGPMSTRLEALKMEERLALELRR